MLSHKAADQRHICSSFARQLCCYPARGAQVSVGFSAHWAIWIARQSNVTPAHVATVQHQQASDRRCTRTAEQLERLCCLHATDNADQRRKDTHGGAAGFLEVSVWRKHTGVTR